MMELMLPEGSIRGTSHEGFAWAPRMKLMTMPQQNVPSISFKSCVSIRTGHDWAISTAKSRASVCAETAHHADQSLCHQRNRILVPYVGSQGRAAKHAGAPPRGLLKGVKHRRNRAATTPKFAEEV